VGLAPALELVNYNVPANSLEGMLEHDLFHDAVVLGRETFPVPIADGAWPHLLRNGEEAARRDPALIVLQPVATLRQVATTLVRYGERLEKDDWLILGSLTNPVPLRGGDRIEADFGPLGRVSVLVST